MSTTPSSDKKPSTTPDGADVSAFYEAETYAPSDSVGHMMRLSLALMAQSIDHQLEPTGLTNAQWLPLYKLYLGVATTVAELARECNHDAGSMTRMLDRLEAKDLCRRLRSSDDRRVVNLELTDAGRTAAKNIPAILSEVQNAYLAGFSHAEWTTLKGFLSRILDNGKALHAAADKK
jgi:DNA-binding MarR family transcriptional regulator